MMAGEKTRLISARDIGLAIGCPLLAAAAWLTPERSWPSLAGKVSPRAGAILSRSQEDIIACIEKTAAGWPLAEIAKTIARQSVEAEIIRNFQFMRDHLPGRWRPRIELAGLEFIDAALAEKRGAILWDSHFFYANLVTKMAFAKAGYGLVHLSHQRHGHSSTRFGVRFLNPLQTLSEKRYLKERLVMSQDGSVAALRTLIQRLAANALVSITVRDSGQAPISVPFMAGQLQIATGALDLAYKCGAALIPVFTTMEDDGRYLVAAERPIIIETGLKRQAAAMAAAQSYAKRLEPHVARHPGQWVGWINI